MHADSNTLGILHSLQEHSLIVRGLFSSWAKRHNFVTLNCIGSFEMLIKLLECSIKIPVVTLHHAIFRVLYSLSVLLENIVFLIVLFI